MCLPLMLFDGLRYTFLALALALWDGCAHGVRWLTGNSIQRNYDYCPSVAVMIVGLNEGDTIVHALRSIYGTYPVMEIFVVDDGSTDGMAEKAESFAKDHPGITVLRRRLRGGKSSAMNMPLPMIKSEIVIVIDSDSELAEGAIWNIIQPFKDPKVGAVSGCVIARNPGVNLCTFLQAFEYRRSIFLGRIILARLGILGIVSGALGAFRKSALDKVGGWDVGPGEDGDLTIKLRKSGYRIAFEPLADCLTNLPTRWYTLYRQRRRWEWAAVTFECRKHIDIGNPMNRHFRVSDFFLAAERWLFNVILIYMNVIYIATLFIFYSPGYILNLVVLFYILYVLADLLQTIVLLFYSRFDVNDLKLALAIPIMPLYFCFMKMVTAIAITEELLFRRSFRDNFVPKRVRESTWHW